MGTANSSGDFVELFPLIRTVREKRPPSFMLRNGSVHLMAGCPVAISSNVPV